MGAMYSIQKMVHLRLTVTKVVFELVGLLAVLNLIFRLTVTKVVFESFYMF